MAKTNINGVAKWIMVSIAVGALVFNTGVIYNDVKHLRNEVAEIKQDLKELRQIVLEKRYIPPS